MVYETFLENIQASVQEKLGTNLRVTLRQILKNNGNVLDGLSIISPDTPLAPTIYLSSYYDEAEHGLPLSVIAEQISLLYEEQSVFPPELYEKLGCFDSVRDKIVFKLVGAEANKVLLSETPHYIFLDLAMVFYVILSENDDGQMTILLHNEHLSLWNITKETLLNAAEYNTPLLLPPRILPIEDALAEITSPGENNVTFPEMTSVSLSVLTNQTGINGAACLLYTDILKNFAAQEEDDLIILPSSIHEVLITPAKKAFSYEDLNEIVSLINLSDVPSEDRLSDHIYRYSREEDRVFIPFICAAACGKVNPQ